jgi:LytS/YehU family sensor histidine kinase
VQAIVWNACWLGGIAVIHHFYRGPEPQLLTQWSQAMAQRSLLSPELSRIVIQLPLALFIGWFMADREAAALDCADSMVALKNLENQERESRNHVLLAQLGPHVLYNSLGALSELVHEDAARAEQALLDVASFYRGLSGICDRPWIRMEEERRLLEQYLAIEQLRLGPRLSVSWHWPEDLKELHMPPLLLLPLVENAIKHGIAPHREGGELRVEAHGSSVSELHFRVTNSGKPLGPPAPEGTGLKNLQTRLSHMGAWLFAFDLRSEDQLTIAELRLMAAPD